MDAGRFYVAGAELESETQMLTTLKACRKEGESHIPEGELSILLPLGSCCVGDVFYVELHKQ